MPQRRLLYLDANDLAAFLWQRGALLEEGRFEPTDAGLALFAEYLRKHRNSLYTVLADVAEEGFHVESIPHTQGADRKALLARKLGQHFYGSPLATAISLGREKSGRRDEIVLFTALTRAQLFEPWLAALRGAEAQLSGIYSVPQLGAALLERLPPPRPQCLLVALTRAGVRQSFFENGRLKFSRLTPLTATSPAEAAAVCAAEAARIHQYLLGQRLAARGTPLPVIALAHPAHVAEFHERCRSSTDLLPEIVDLHALSHSCGLKTLPADSNSESLFLHLLAHRAPSAQFAPAAERRLYRLRQARFALKAFGAAVLIGGLLFAGKQFNDALGLRALTDETRLQADADGAKYAAIQKTFPPMPAAAETLRAVINRHDEIARFSPPLEPLLGAISSALEDAPRVELERIEWLQSANSDVGAPVQDARRPADAASEKLGGASLHTVALIYATLPLSMAGDQRGQLGAINHFADTLRKDAALTVTIPRLPFDIESAKSLKSSADIGAGASQPRFTVQISRKL